MNAKYIIAIVALALAQSAAALQLILNGQSGGTIVGGVQVDDQGNVIVNTQASSTPTGDTVRLSTSSVTVTEGEIVSFQVTRTGNSADDVGVDLSITPLKATEGADYDITGVPLRLLWPLKTVGPQQIDIPTIDDDVPNEGSETFTVAIKSPTTGATLGSPSVATVTILDNDQTATTTCPPAPAGVQVVNFNLAWTGLGTNQPQVKLGRNQAAVAAVTTSIDPTRVGSVSVVPASGAVESPKLVTISKCPADFRTTELGRCVAEGVDAVINYTQGTPKVFFGLTTECALDPNEQYYVNVRNATFTQPTTDTCPALANCGFAVKVY